MPLFIATATSTTIYSNSQSVKGTFASQKSRLIHRRLIKVQDRLLSIMSDQKASKYYPAEEEAQMKKVCARVVFSTCHEALLVARNMQAVGSRIRS